MGELTIGEVARQTGLATSALRYYERIGLLPRPRRVNGRRRYDAAVLRQLAVLQFARRAGFTLAEMQGLVGGLGAGAPPAERWQAVAERKLAELQAQIASARQRQQVLHSGLNCACASWDDCALLTGAAACA
jgi:MerR family redox-sensitive transcriptional activator SoxR